MSNVFQIVVFTVGSLRITETSAVMLTGFYSSSIETLFFRSTMIPPCFVIIFFLTSNSLASVSEYSQKMHRRILHQPFFPTDSSFTPPPASPLPFFPTNPSPFSFPPPPPTVLQTSPPTFPTNTTTHTTSHSITNKSSSKVAIITIFSVIFFILIASLLLFLRHRHLQKFDKKGTRPANHQLFPSNDLSGSSLEEAKEDLSTNNSQFLYLGTLVNTHRIETCDAEAVLNLDSPEIQPLPPLVKKVIPQRENEESEEEEFFSPRVSSVVQPFPEILEENYVHGSSRTASYPGSNLVSRSPSSDSNSCLHFITEHHDCLNSPNDGDCVGEEYTKPPVNDLDENSVMISESAGGIHPFLFRFVDFSNYSSSLLPSPLEPNKACSNAAFSHCSSPLHNDSVEIAEIISDSNVQNKPSPSRIHSSLTQELISKSLSPTEKVSTSIVSDSFALLQKSPSPNENLVSSTSAVVVPLSPSQTNSESTLYPLSLSSEEDRINNKDKNSDSRIQIKLSPSKLGNLSGLPSSTPPPPPPPPPVPGFWKIHLSNISGPLHTAIDKGTTNKQSVFTIQQWDNVHDAERCEETLKPKLKPLHWDKVRASSNRATVWDQLQSSSFQLNEEMIETLFLNETPHSEPKEIANRRLVLPSPSQGNNVLDPKKSQNIAIMLRALNVIKEEVCEALLEGNTEGIDAELLETLLKMAPTEEEERKLKEHTDVLDESSSKLGSAEKFLKSVLDIPFAFKRVEALLYIINFDSEIKYLKQSFETLEAACEELRNNRLFLKILEAVLRTGNRMNVGTNRGDAHAFKLDTLLKLVDIKGTDGKTTLLHFVVQEIVRAEGSRLSSIKTEDDKKCSKPTAQEDSELRKLGLKAVSGLTSELCHVKKAAAMDFDMLNSYVTKLARGITRVAEVERLNQTPELAERNQKFSMAMGSFLKTAENEIIKIQAHESVAFSLVKEITEYFHGNSAKEEARPFRIFMVVRDFLSILDRVCKEVGKINERTTFTSARQLPVPVNPTLIPVFPRLHLQRHDSSDDESSKSSP